MKILSKILIVLFLVCYGCTKNNDLSLQGSYVNFQSYSIDQFNNIFGSQYYDDKQYYNFHGAESLLFQLHYSKMSKNDFEKKIIIIEENGWYFLKKYNNPNRG